jgi:hypothetical protein
MEGKMVRILYALLADWLNSLRGIVERHPAVFSVSAWSAPHSGGVAER